MEAHDDLRKFITEFTVAPVRAVLSSGRGADTGVGGTGRHRCGTGQHREIVGRLTPWAGIESSMAMGSDQTAAEALQEAETEVGVTVNAFDRGSWPGRVGRRFGAPIG